MGEFISLGTAIKTDPQRVSIILDVVMDFFDGVQPSQLAERVKKELVAITAGEFAYAAQILAKKDDGADPFEAKLRRELLMHEVFDDALEDSSGTTEPAGHPLSSFRAENHALKDVVAAIRSELLEPRSERSDMNVADSLRSLSQVNVHYTRKENQLFPYLERKGFDRPSTIMWAQHDAIRGFIKDAMNLVPSTTNSIDTQDTTAFVEATVRAIDAVIDMIGKEEQVLFPTSLELLDQNEWAEMRGGDDEISYCLIEQPPDWVPAPANDQSTRISLQDLDLLRPAVTFAQATTASDTRAHSQPPIGAIQLSGGHLTTQQLNGIFPSRRTRNR